MTLGLLKSIDSRLVKAQLKIVHVGQNFDFFMKKMTFPKSIRDHPRKLPQAPGHQKTSKIITGVIREGSGNTLKNRQKSS